MRPETAAATEKAIDRPGSGGAIRRRGPALALAGLIGAAAALAPAAGPARAQAPLSAIDWLQDSPPSPPVGNRDSNAGAHDAGAHPVTPDTGDLWVRDIITMQSIDAPRPEAVGLFPAARAGLPAGLWGATPAVELAALLRALPTDTLPALRRLGLALLLAEFTPPAAGPGAASDIARQDAANAFVLARIDKLIAFGALDQAAAILEALGSADMALRERAFDIALLLGDEGPACRDVLEGTPPFTGAAQRIFCLARAGRWAEAERLHAQLSEANRLRPPYRELLEQFLDADDIMHGDEPPPWLGEDYVQPQNLSPLAWRLLEAVGAPVAAHGLPVAFAHADLRGTIGWRAQLEAAERLVRAGALPPNRLLGLYSERHAAASGGIWERVRAIQQLEAALERGAGAPIGAALERAWPLIVDAELEVAFAALYAEALLAAPLEGAAAGLAAAIGLLDADPGPAARRLADGDARQRFLSAVALGAPPEPPPGSATVLQQIIAEVMGPDLPALPDGLAGQIAAGRAGEALLVALARLDGVIDPHALGNALALMRHLGLDEPARATALQALILERRG